MSSACLKVGIYGPGRSGKDAAAEWFAANTRLRYWGSTSQVITPHAAKRLGISEREEFRRRHEDRALWRQIGDELREVDPAALARVTLWDGDLNVGVRSLREIAAVRRERLVDVALWIDRPGVPEDPTLEFDESFADVIVPNRWGLPEFHARLANLARAWGVLRG